jgi:hypothetical protein
MAKARRRSRLSFEAQKAFLVQFVAATPAGLWLSWRVNRNSVPLFYRRIRELIVARLAEESPFIEGEVEVAETILAATVSTREDGAAGKVQRERNFVASHHCIPCRPITSRQTIKCRRHSMLLTALTPMIQVFITPTASSIRQI